ncbi:MAG: chemotaxis protein CheW [Woeseiaceae bacterium]|nr:chemotaxis protein CheW [Woeseiaceae bacterium]
MSDATEELYSLLVPLVADRLIVPRACVAEVVRYVKPEETAGNQPWFMGNVNWSGRSLPVVSFEGALGKDIPAITGRTRIVVFYATTGKVHAGFFGVLTQGFPQLVRVNRDVLKVDATDGWPAESPVLCRVKMINEFPLIPDLEARSR